MLEMDMMYTRKAVQRVPFKLVDTNPIARLMSDFLQKLSVPQTHTPSSGWPIRLLWKTQQLFSKTKLLFTKGSSTKVCHLRNVCLQESICHHLNNMPLEETPITPLLDFLLAENDVFYDIGSGWGFYSGFAASCQNFDGQILAFEPSSDKFDDLQQFIHDAELNDFISAYNIHLTDKHSSNLTSQHNTSTTKTRLDQIQAPSPDVIMIAPTGNASDIISSGIEKIERNSPFIIFHHKMNYPHSNLHLKTFDLLDNLDYALFQVCWVKQKPYQFDLMNDHKNKHSNQAQMALIPLTRQDKSFHKKNLHILACPLSKIKHIEKAFQSVHRQEISQIQIR